MDSNDELIESVGKFGKYQYKLSLLVGLISALSSACIYATIFVAGEPELKCHLKSWISNETSTISSSVQDPCKIWSSITDEEKSKKMKRFDDFECSFDETYYSETIITDWNLICNQHYLASLTQTTHIFGSIFGFFGGIFGDRYGRKRSTVIFSLMLTATLVVSQLLISSNFLFNLSITIKYIVYSVSQFLVGLLVNCVYCTSYVLLLESTTEQYRTIISNVHAYFYVLGELIVLVVYYLSRNWQVLNWFVAFYSLVLCVITLYLKESPSWLISCNRHQEAYLILNSIAKQNGIKNFKLPNRHHDRLTKVHETDDSTPQQSLLARRHHQRSNDEDDDDDEFNTIDEQNDSNMDETYSKSLSLENHSHISASIEPATNSCMGVLRDLKVDILMFKSIFTPGEYLVKTCVLFYVWTALMLLYYGISLGVMSVDLVNPYLMYFLSSIAEIVGYVLCYLNDVLGRKMTTLGFLVLTTVMYTLIAFISHDLEENDSNLSSSLLFNLTSNQTNVLPTSNSIDQATSSNTNTLLVIKGMLLMIFGLIGKCAVSGFYNIAYIYTSELYSVTTRNTALLFLTCFGGISSLVAPQINQLKTKIWNPLPYIIYSVCALLAFLCVLYLPETLKKKRHKQTGSIVSIEN